MLEVIGGILDWHLNNFGVLPDSWARGILEKPRRPGPWD
jgi:hypothetical protein